MENQNPNEKV
jgi:hypothetical protein